MLKTKAIRKIFTTTLSMFIILTIFTFPLTSKEKNILRTNLEIEDVTNLTTDKVYLLNKDNLLVRTDIFLDGKNKLDKAKNIIEYLIINNEKIPKGLNGYIPKNTKLLNIKEEESKIILDFSKEFKNYNQNQEKQIITGIVFSLMEIDEIESITILVEGNYLDKYREPLNKNIGINNQYFLNSRNDLNKVVLYYQDNIENNLYYVPVTKYLNDKREKVEIIIDELKNNNSSSNLISYLNNNLELIDHKEESDVLFLNFNDYLIDKNDEVTKNTLNSIAYSVLENYDVNMVMFEVDNKEVSYISKKDM